MHSAAGAEERGSDIRAVVMIRPLQCLITAGEESSSPLRAPRVSAATCGGQKLDFAADQTPELHFLIHGYYQAHNSADMLLISTRFSPTLKMKIDEMNSSLYSNKFEPQRSG